jgi:outer membrane protein assembly factor BamB
MGDRCAVGRRLASRARIGVGLVLATVIAWCVPAFAQAASTQAGAQPKDSYVADEATPVHDGHVTGSHLTPPLSKLWSVNFDTTPLVGYASPSIQTVLVVGRSTFVSMFDNSGGHVFALDRATGGLLWGPAGSGGPIAYDAGRVFGITTGPLGNVAYALDAATGRSLWTVNLPGQQDYGEPTASSGVLYAVGDGMVAVDESTGAITWRSAWRDGTQDNVTVTPTALFYAGPCDDFFAVDPANGSSLWSHSGTCSGGGHGTLSYHSGLLYGGGWAGGSQGLIIDAATGAQVGSYPNKAQVAFDANTAFWLSGGNLQAYDLGTHTILWTFAGDGSLFGDPLVVNGIVYVSSSHGMVYGLRESGGVAWSRQAAAGLSHLSAGTSTLFVASGAVLSAWGAGAPSPTIASVAPVAGPTNGGTVVTITGSGLSGATGIRFGSTAGKNLKVLSDNVVTAVSPPGAVGTVVITVQTPSGRTTFNPDASFTYFNDAPEVTSADASTFRMDPRHLATADGGSFTLPSGAHWTKQLGGRVSYPLIVGNRVYVIVQSSSSTNLYALDAQTGTTVWGPVAVGSAFGLTYDQGRIYTIDGDDLVQAFNSSDGSFVWSARMAQSFSDALPTAVDGVLYTAGTGSGGTVYATNEANGALLWSAGVANGDWSAPTIANGHVFVSYGCDVAYSFPTTGGAATWGHYDGCSGGGGATTALYQGRLYVRDSSIVLDELNGHELAPNPSSGRVQTFSGNATYFLNGSTLMAVALGSNSTMWSFTGDGGLNSDPIEANGYVYVGSSTGTVFALDASTGAVAWSGVAGDVILASGESGGFGAPPVTAMAIGDGVLAVPAGNSLTVFR